MNNNNSIKHVEYHHKGFVIDKILWVLIFELTLVGKTKIKYNRRKMEDHYAFYVIAILLIHL